jgi:3-oxoacyl-[acyl-carrier-protein] synthase II
MPRINLANDQNGGMMNNLGPIWITGVGAISPLGDDFAEISASLLAGKCAIRPVTGFDVSEHPCQIAGQLSLPKRAPEIGDKVYDSVFPLDECAIWCSREALRDAGLWPERRELQLGLVLGVAAEAMSHWDTDVRRGGDSLYSSSATQPSAAHATVEALEISGPVATVAAACASGNHALAVACEWLRLGWIDVCLAGACDMGVTPYSLASFGNLRALSRRNDAPTEAVRPFDCDRDGMVLGEGGAIFVLETADRATSRGRDAYAEVMGIGMTSDAYHLVIPSPDPMQAVTAMQQALVAARVNPEDVDYVNAHATGTPVGDVCEARALQMVFGNHTMDIPVSSTKSMTGHLLGAAAAIEALACLTAITNRAIPPTINLHRPDPECSLRHVANEAQGHEVRVAMSNSFGFGGHNTSLLLRCA